MERIHEKDVFKSKMKNKFDTKQADSETLKPKFIEINDLLAGLNNAPDKMFLTNQPGKTSVRSDKKDENNEHGGEGKEMG